MPFNHMDLLRSHFKAWITTSAILVTALVSSAHNAGAASLRQTLDPPEVKVGAPATITLTVEGGVVQDVRLPHVDGLHVGETSYQIKSIETNDGYSNSVAISISVVPGHAGYFDIPAFEIQTQEGAVLQVKAMKLHALGTADTLTMGADQAPPPAAAVSAVRVGPVVMLPTIPATNSVTPNNGTSAADRATQSDPGIPRDADGTPAKVFMVITPQTTDAYVGEAVPMRIEFYIRMEVVTEQNSLPTIKGSDFLMNSFTTRGQQLQGNLENLLYLRETWLTAISAPKEGDFPLSMQRNTYWIKSGNTDSTTSFFGVFNRRINPAHEMISSNSLTMHIHPLPTEGQPAHFTGVIGQFKVTGQAEPLAVAVGEPVTLRFTVSGNGNFDYVRCPFVPPDPAWKNYVPRSSIQYLPQDPSHTNAVKTFEQAVVPQRNGTLPLPTAHFNYFDPGTKQYITVPIELPPVVVTGSTLPVATAKNPDGENTVSAEVNRSAVDFLPNRLDAGTPRLNFTPVFRQPWFWVVQAGLACLPMLGALLFFLRLRTSPDDLRLARERHDRSLRQEESAMADAVRQRDAPAFFQAARHAIQLQLGQQWKLNPAAITWHEIRNRDTALAAHLQPLFALADEVIYSGKTKAGLDLAAWEQRVRTEFLHPQSSPL